MLDRLPVLVVAAASLSGVALGAQERPLPGELAAAEGRTLLIVRGDDFGDTHASNVALRTSFADGIMTSATVMVPTPWFAETAAILRDRPKWSAGVHLTITSQWDRLRWRPVLPAAEVPSLVAPDGGFYVMGYYWAPKEYDEAHVKLLAPGPPRPEEVEAELRAQILEARRQGIRIDHLDCHMWVVCGNHLRPVLEGLSREFCLPLGNLDRFGEGTGYAPAPMPRERVREELEAWLRAREPGLWLYVDHPSVDGPEMRGRDSQFGDRFAEHQGAVAELWADPSLRDLLDELDIELVSYRDLWDYERCEPRRDLPPRAPGSLSE